MRNTMKVAKWEIKRNLKNKSFVIGLFLTPILMVVFGFLGNLMGGDTSDSETAKIYVHDELNTFANLEATVEQYKLPLELEKTNIQEADVEKKLKNAENTAYFLLIIVLLMKELYRFIQVKISRKVYQVKYKFLQKRLN